MLRKIDRFLPSAGTNYKNISFFHPYGTQSPCAISQSSSGTVLKERTAFVVSPVNLVKYTVLTQNHHRIAIQTLSNNKLRTRFIKFQATSIQLRIYSTQKTWLSLRIYFIPTIHSQAAFDQYS